MTLSLTDIKTLGTGMVPKATGSRLLTNPNITDWKRLQDLNPQVKVEYPEVYRNYYVQWWLVTLKDGSKVTLCFEINPCF